MRIITCNLIARIWLSLQSCPFWIECVKNNGGSWLADKLYQPSNCLIDDCPIARCDGGDSSGLVDELLPSFLAGIKNVGVGLEHAVGEIGLAQVLPDVLSRVEFRTCWRQ